MKNKTIVVGIGHPARSDDGLGPKVIEMLDVLLPKEVKRLTLSGDLSLLLDIFSQFDKVIIVDAIQTKTHSNGTQLRFEGNQIKNLPRQSHTSTHAFDITQAIQLAENLGALPKSLVIFGIESNHFEPGESLSFLVQTQLPHLIEDIVKEINDA